MMISDRWPSTLFRCGLLLLALPFGACADAGLLELEVVLPEGDDPLAEVTRLRLGVTSPAAERVVELSSATRFTIEKEIEIDGEVGTVVLEGFAGADLVARGETPPLILRTVEERLALLVGPAGAMATLRQRLPTPGRQMAVVLLPALGVLAAGGVDGGGGLLDAVALYDIYDHQLLELPALPAPRAGAVAVSCGGSCAVIALGQTDSGLATSLLQLDGGVWRELGDGLGGAQGSRRTGASAMPLDDGRYLLAGGEGKNGEPLASLLALEWVESGLQLVPLAAGAVVPRTRPAVAVAGTKVLLAGGQRQEQPSAELITLPDGRGRAVTLPGPALAGGAAAVTLADGRLALVGGRGVGGEALADAWVIDPERSAVEHLPGALAQARADHAAMVVDGRIVVVGGGAGGAPVASVEVLAATGSLARVRQAELGRARLGGHGLARLGGGSLLVVGGAEQQGQPAAELELYETF